MNTFAYNAFKFATYLLVHEVETFINSILLKLYTALLWDECAPFPGIIYTRVFGYGVIIICIFNVDRFSFLLLFFIVYFSVMIIIIIIISICITQSVECI
jgi:hypothetical protein